MLLSFKIYLQGRKKKIEMHKDLASSEFWAPSALSRPPYQWKRPVCLHHHSLLPWVLRSKLQWEIQDLNPSTSVHDTDMTRGVATAKANDLPSWYNSSLLLLILFLTWHNLLWLVFELDMIRKMLACSYVWLLRWIFDSYFSTVIFFYILNHYIAQLYDREIDPWDDGQGKAVPSPPSGDEFQRPREKSKLSSLRDVNIVCQSFNQGLPCWILCEMRKFGVPSVFFIKFHLMT